MAEQNYIIASTDSGSVNIGEDVFVGIVTATIAEVPAVAGLSSSFGTELAELLGKKSLNKGVNIVSEEDGTLRIDVVILVRYGYNVAQTAEAVQEKVCAAVADMTGIHCRVNVHVTGISFEKAEIK